METFHPIGGVEAYLSAVAAHAQLGAIPVCVQLVVRGFCGLLSLGIRLAYPESDKAIREGCNEVIRMKACSILLLMLALTWSTRAGAEIYQWTDAKGTLHITENLAQVPAQYRAQATGPSRKPSGMGGLQRYESRKATPQHVASLSISSLRHSSPGGEILVPFERDGNLMKVNVRLNDRVVAPFYVDTGASDISIPKAVGDRLGVVTPSNMRMATEITASGAIQVPVITLESVQLGGARVPNLLATINPMLEVGLLGGSFFNNFSYSVDPAAGVILLRRN